MRTLTISRVVLSFFWLWLSFFTSRRSYVNLVKAFSPSLPISKRGGGGSGCHKNTDAIGIWERKNIFFDRYERDDDAKRFVGKKNRNAMKTSLTMLPCAGGAGENVFDTGSIMLSVVDFFDGRTVIDPVVVSSVIWNGIQSKILFAIVAPILASVVFAFVATLFVSQLPKIGEFVVARFLSNTAKVQVDKLSRQVIDQSKQSSTRQPNFVKLALCLMIDFIGSSSNLVPILGKATDVIWAPFAAIGIRTLYRSNIIFVLEFLENIIPFADILPLATICWVVETFYSDSKLAKALQLGQFESGRVIDAKSEPVMKEDIKRLESSRKDDKKPGSK